MSDNGHHARWRRNDTVVMNIANHPAQQRGYDDRNQHRRVNVTGRQNRDDKEAQDTEQYAVGRQVTDRHQRVFVGDDNTGVFQPHHADEQTNTAGDPHTQANRDIGNHPVTNAENRQQQQTNSAPEDSAHTNLP